MRFRHREREFDLEAMREGSTLTLETEGCEPHSWEVRRVGTAEFVVADDAGELHTVYAMRDGDDWWIWLDGRAYRLERIVARGAGAGAAGNLTAPIPATVQEILVGEGDEVEPGQVLLVLSAMKMQLEVKAPIAGTVRALDLETGQRVDTGVELLEIEPLD